MSREGNYRDANVTALLFDVNTKENKYNFSGSAKSSSIFDVKSSNGFYTDFNFRKKFGNWRYSFGTQYASKDYDINDLGINFINNYHAFSSNLSYRILNPTKIFNSLNTNVNVYTQFHNDFGKIQEFGINYNFNSTNKKNDFYGFGFYFQPTPVYDFFEPRVENRFLTLPDQIATWLYFSSNYNRKFAIDINPDFTIFNQDNRFSLGISISPRYRVNNKLAFIYSFEYRKNSNEIGWVDFSNQDIILANRNRITFTNNLNIKYTISPQMSINCNGRYYWSFAEVNQFQTLLDDGSFTPNYIYNSNKNNNFALFNFDLSYSWWFVPGSQITALYRNNAQNNDRIINKSFANNFSKLFDNHLNQTFSISIR
ncbi:MAG: DUF5916 domain-containing protein, partial [Flavobacterium sp.]